MSSLIDRLRSVVHSGGSTGQDRIGWPTPQEPPSTPLNEGPASAGDPADILDGTWQTSGDQCYLVIDRRYLPGHRHGHLAVADVLPPGDGVWPRLSLLEASLSQCERLVFIDLETTGLAGGAGTSAFLVGCAWFDGPVFRVRQFFLSTLGAERALLDGLSDLVQSTDAIVTYNGKTFDMPVVETRFALHRLPNPFEGMAHLDMLHCARRLWRAETSERPSGQSTCRLSAIEAALCGYVRDGDVPGYEIPSRYFHYVRTGDARSLGAVLEHNRLDLLALAWITARAARLLEEGACAAGTSREAFGLGQLYERAGGYAEARACFARAYDLGREEDALRAHALRAYAVLSRRERLYEDAAAAWRRLLEFPQCPSPLIREATEALAIHHEHRARDLYTARLFALKALQLESTVHRRDAVQHRLARLDRKLDAPVIQLATLF